MHLDIYGQRYELDQSFTANDKKSLLKNKESDILFEYELPEGMTATEAIHELFLRHNEIFHLKPSDVSSQEFVKGMRIIYDNGFDNGRKDCALFWIAEIQTYYEGLEED